MGINGNLGVYHAFYSLVPGTALHNFREADANGDVGAIAANGGILASDTTPIMRGAATLISQELSWATGNADPIVCQCPLPDDFDGREDVLVELSVYSGTNDDASFTVATSWDGGATVSDTADDSATLSATAHKITARILAADIPDSPSHLTLLLTPAAHASDAIQLQGVKVKYLPKTSS